MAHWYYGENGSQVGPLDENAIRAAIGEGRVNQQTLVWREGMASWLPLSGVPELSSSAPVYGPPGTPVYYGPTSGPVAGRTSGLAVASMVCGIVAWVSCLVLFGLPAIAAVIFGHIALGTIKNSPIPLGGRGMAISGLIMGYLMILTMAGGIIAMVIGGTVK